MERYVLGKWLLVLASSYSLLGGYSILDIGGVPGLTPQEQAVHDAASLKDPQHRVDALRNAIRTGLFSADREVRDRVFSYLSLNSRWIDLRPYVGVIEEFAKTDPLHRGLWLLDDNELARRPRAERLVVCRAAIEDGMTTLLVLLRWQWRSHGAGNTARVNRGDMAGLGCLGTARVQRTVPGRD